jgi:hypothetical protein
MKFHERGFQSLRYNLRFIDAIDTKALHLDARKYRIGAIRQASEAAGTTNAHRIKYTDGDTTLVCELPVVPGQV